MPQRSLLLQRLQPHALNAAYSMFAVARDLLKNVPDASIVEDVVGKFSQWRS
jgi:hypothetical protein